MKKEYKIYETPKNTPAYGTVGNLSGSRKSASGTVKKTTAAKTTAAKNTAGKSSSGGRAPVIYHEQVKPGAAGSLASNAGKTGANVKKPSPVAAAKPGAQSTAASKPAASKPASAQKPVIYHEQINPGAAGTLASNAGRTGKNTARPLSSTNWFLTHKPAAHTQSSDPFLSAFEDDGPSWHEKIYNAYHKSLPKRKKDDTVDMFLEEFDKEETPERRFYGEQVSPGAAGALTGLSSTRRKPIYHEQISPGARGGLEENAQYSAQKQYGRTDQASLAGSLAQNGEYSKYAQFSHNTQIDPARLAGSLAQNANYHGTAPQQMQFNATVKQIEAFAAANPNRSLSKNTLQEYMQQRNTEYLSGISHTLPQGTAA